MNVATIDGRRFAIALHAVDRYRERMRPGFSRGQAARDLRLSLAERGEIHLAPPAWARSRVARDMVPDEWVVLEDERILFPVRGGLILTCCPEREHRVGAQIRVVR